MLSDMELFEIKFYFLEKWDSVVGFFENLKYMFQHIHFLWTSKSIRIWDSCYLIDLIEYRLKKLKECLEEEYLDIMKSVDPLNIEDYKHIKEDREGRINSIAECLYQLSIYKDTEQIISQPTFLKEFYEENGHILDMNNKFTKEQNKEYIKYIKESLRLEKKSLKNLFKIMGESIENWWV